MNSQSDYQILIAIDIGLTGGIAFFDWETHEVLALYSMPATKITTKAGRKKGEIILPRLKHILEIPKLHEDGALVVMENIHAFPGQGLVATATLLEQKGIIRGLCSGLGYGEYFVTPRTWQSHFKMIPPKTLSGNSTAKTKALRKNWLKEESLNLTRRAFPEWAKTKLLKGSAHGISDALLIGMWYLESNGV